MAPKRTNSSLVTNKKTLVSSESIASEPVKERHDIETCVVYGLLHESDLLRNVPSVLSSFCTHTVLPFRTTHTNLLENDISPDDALVILRRNEQGLRGLREFKKLCLRHRSKIELTMDQAVTRISSYFRMFRQRASFRRYRSEELYFLNIRRSCETTPISFESRVYEKLVATETLESAALELAKSKMVDFLSTLSTEWESRIRGGIWKFKECNNRFPDSIDQVEQLLASDSFIVPVEVPKKGAVPKKAIASSSTTKVPRDTTHKELTRKKGWTNLLELETLLSSHVKFAFNGTKIESIFAVKMKNNLINELAILKGENCIGEAPKTDSELRDIQQDFIDLVKLGLVVILPRVAYPVDDLIEDLAPLRSQIFPAEGVIGKNMLLYGPPGCGKSFRVTSIASLLARETAPVWILNLRSASLSLCAKIIAVATVYGPFVVLLDNIDAKQTILADFLTKLKSARCVVIGTCNRPDITKGLLEIFAKKIPVFPLNEEEREKFFRVNNCSPLLAKMTEGLAIVDLVRLVQFPLCDSQPKTYIDALSRLKPVKDWQT